MILLEQTENGLISSHVHSVILILLIESHLLFLAFRREITVLIADLIVHHVYDLALLGDFLLFLLRLVDSLFN